MSSCLAVLFQTRAGGGWAGGWGGAAARLDLVQVQVVEWAPALPFCFKLRPARGWAGGWGGAAARLDPVQVQAVEQARQLRGEAGRVRARLALGERQDVVRQRLPVLGGDGLARHGARWLTARASASDRPHGADALARRRSPPALARPRPQAGRAAAGVRGRARGTLP